MAWQEFKKGVEIVEKKVEVILKGSTKRVKTWLAEITGKHPQFVLNREFLSPDEFNEWGEKVFYLDKGLYEVYDGKRRKFVHVENGKDRLIEREEAIFIADKM